MPGCNSSPENEIVSRARRMLASYENMAELIRLGAYRRGSDADTDAAMELYPQLEAFLHQGLQEKSSLAEGYAALARALNVNWP